MLDSAEIIIIVIDIEKNIDDQFLKWSKYIQDNEKLFSSFFKILLIFNKYDLNTSFEVPGYILENERFSFISVVSAKTSHNIDKLKTQLDLSATKIIDEHARTSHENTKLYQNSQNSRGINNEVYNGSVDNSNIRKNENDTIFGSTFSNIKINVNISDYKEKMKRYYENTRC